MRFLNQIIKKYKSNRWQIAYRMHNSETFVLLDNPSWGWAADPFPIEYKGELYIFAEIFLYKSERNGVIAYCKYDGDRFSDWKVSMDRHWHLSYPNVWVENNQLYMCPESYQNEEIAIYKLIELPDKWIKEAVLLNNEKCVDTTFLNHGNKKYVFVYKPTFIKENGTLYLYELCNGKMNSARYISDDISNSRPGGNIIKKDNKIIRVAQNSEGGYGLSLVFNEIKRIEPIYIEIPIMSIKATDIPGDWKKKFIGIHTYNHNASIEVVDLKYEVFSLAEYRARMRVKKVFTNKY
nr:hypothetical protein [uncultured Acetatifactor sp.]